MSLWKTISALGVCAGAGLLFAQEGAVVIPDSVKLETKIMAEGAAGGLTMGVRFMSAEFGFAGRTVKGMPYQAQAVTETTQTLADGNRIVHKSTALLARDSEGRTRREQKIDAVGQWATGDQPAPLVFIQDPVAQTSYVLESNSKIARKMGPAADKAMAEAKMTTERRAVAIHGATGNVEFHKQSLTTGEPVKESLGTKTIEGTVAEGTRFTSTIPAGKMGNDRPLTFVNETWFSQDLGMIVMSRHTDPQMGETLYTLTNIQRSEPDASLFTIPAGYTVKEGGLQTFTVERDQN